MSSMNLVRSAISILLITLVVIAVGGWVQAGGRPSPAQEGARLALGLSGVVCLVCLGVLWRAKSARSKAR